MSWGKTYIPSHHLLHLPLPVSKLMLMMGNVSREEKSICISQILDSLTTRAREKDLLGPSSPSRYLSMGNRWKIYDAPLIAHSLTRSLLSSSHVKVKLLQHPHHHHGKSMKKWDFSKLIKDRWSELCVWVGCWLIYDRVGY